MQDGGKLHQEGVIFYSLSTLYVFPSVVCNINLTEKVSRLYPCPPMCSHSFTKSPCKIYPHSLCQSKLCSVKSVTEADKNVFIIIPTVWTYCAKVDTFNFSFAIRRALLYFSLPLYPNTAIWTVRWGRFIIIGFT